VIGTHTCAASAAGVRSRHDKNHPLARWAVTCSSSRMPIVKSQTLSFVLHIASLGILLFLTTRPVSSPSPAVRERVLLVAPHDLSIAKAAPQHSGGSNKTPLPARRGEPPPRGLKTFIEPASVRDPKLSMAISVVFDSPTIEIEPAAIGDPSSKLLAGDFGRKGGKGIGEVESPGGIGPAGEGAPGIKAGARPGHNFTPPRLIHQVEPEFSEEARKAKFQGVVVLAIEIDTGGRPTHLRILQGLGLGLDEKAIRAVEQWRFWPALQDGRPVVTAARVEVNFRLL